MKKDWSKNWIGSKQSRKQRKYRANAPLHIRQKFVSVHLSKELREKYKTRSLAVRVGDKVEILRGKNKKQSGKVERVDLKKTKIYVSKIERIKKEGTKTLIPLQPSNLMIVELNTDDKRRFGRDEKKNSKKTEDKKTSKPSKSDADVTDAKTKPSEKKETKPEEKKKASPKPVPAKTKSETKSEVKQEKVKKEVKEEVKEDVRDE